MCKKSDKLIADAKEKGLTYLNRDEGRYHLYRFNDCRHTQKIRSDKVISGQFQCRACNEAEYQKEAEKHNLTLVEFKKLSCGNHVYRFNECGHTQEIRTDNLKIGKFRCKTCSKEKHEVAAEQYNLKIIKHIHADKFLYELPCGHTKEISRSKVLVGSFQCQVCDASYHTQPSKLYLVKMYNRLTRKSWVKLGIAKNIEHRIKNYGLSSFITTKILFEKDFETHLDALTIEQNLHSKYKDKKVDPEFMKRYMKSGFSECYPFSFFTTINQEILAN